MMKIETSRRYINYPMLLKIIGWLLMIEALFMSIPTLTCLYYDESDVWPFGFSALITGVIGLSLTHGIKAQHSRMGRREGFLLTASVWVIFSLFGMLPFIFSQHPIGVTDAFFETISGFTTTGASIYQPGVELSHGIHIWRALTQWIGGMGIILFTLAVIPMLNSSGGMQMFNAEVTGITHDKVRPRISQTAKALWLTYILLTVIIACLLLMGPMDVFDSICYAFGTASTGGYSTRNSIEYFNSNYVKIVITIFMFLSSVNFALLIRGWFNGIKNIWRDEIFRIYLKTTLLCIILVMVATIIQGVGLNFEDTIVDPMFQVVSAFTSTGYAIEGFDHWGTFIFSIMLALIFIGGCSGSTTGGIKLDRIVFVVKYCRNELYRCVHPNAVLSVRINNKVQSASVVQKVMVFFSLFIFLLLAGTSLMSLFGVSIGDSLYSGMVCMSNSALDLNMTDFGSNYGVLPSGAKWVLSAMMLIGRLELFTIILLLSPSFWRK